MSAASASGLHLLGHKETHSEQESWFPTEVGAGFPVSCPAEDAAVFFLFVCLFFFFFFFFDALLPSSEKYSMADFVPFA